MCFMLSIGFTRWLRLYVCAVPASVANHLFVYVMYVYSLYIYLHVYIYAYVFNNYLYILIYSGMKSIYELFVYTARTFAKEQLPWYLYVTERLVYKRI